MKSDDDLMREFMKWLFDHMRGPSAKAKLIKSQFDRFWSSRAKKPPTPMSDMDYAMKLEQLKVEAPGFLHFLESHSFPELPSNLQPFPKN